MMTWAILLLTLPAQVEHPLQKLGDIEASLTVTVPERTDRSSPPRVLLTLTVTGPATMRVEAATLGEEVRSWRVSRWSSWTPGDRLTVAQTLLLEQTLPGMQAVPGVRVRVWSSPGAMPQQFEWPDPMGPLVWIPEPPVPRPAPEEGRWLLYAGLAAALALAVIGLATWRWLRRPAPPPPPTPTEAAQAALHALAVSAAWTDPRAAATRLSDTLRTFLSARTGLDLHPRTVAECLELLRDQPVTPAQMATLERLLLWCDVTRFAGPAADASAGPEMVAEAQRWVASFPI